MQAAVLFIQLIVTKIANVLIFAHPGKHIQYLDATN
jgi:hypothetical protein